MSPLSNLKSGNCPWCHTSPVRRSHRRNYVEHLLANIFRIFPYRCKHCDFRFYAFSQKDRSLSADGSESSSRQVVGFSPVEAKDNGA